uniref:Mos1 transposase HTH domain-containing protein n=1 Tax=Glossina palpalis gambiensis TaxID=67801 RepID=A0A1B0AX33_9MUSC
TTVATTIVLNIQRKLRLFCQTKYSPDSLCNIVELFQPLVVMYVFLTICRLGGCIILYHSCAQCIKRFIPQRLEQVMGEMCDLSDFGNGQIVAARLAGKCFVWKMSSYLDGEKRPIFGIICFYEFRYDRNATFVAAKDICDAYPSALNVRKCKRYFSKFKSGNIDLSDSYRSGRSTTLNNGMLRAEVEANPMSSNRRTAKHC